MNNSENILNTNEDFEKECDNTENTDIRESNEYAEIKTEIELTQEGNFHNDCGALSASMVLKSFNPELLKEYNLEKIEVLTDKEGEEGILPGNLCKALTEMGLDVEYYSSIDWGRCTLDPNKYFEFYPDNIKNLPPKFFKSDDNKDGMVDKDKLSHSAQWLEENKNIINRHIVDHNLISSLLCEGKKLIALIHGSHYVVITGIDKDNMYINNPQTEPRKDIISKDQFDKTWLNVLNSKELIVISN